MAEDGNYVYHTLENMLGDISQEERERRITETGQRASAEFPKNLVQLQALLKKYAPIYPMSVITRNALMVNAGPEGVIEAESSGQIGRHQAELLQALVTATPKDTVSPLNPNPYIIQEAVDLLESASAHFPFSRFDAAVLSLDLFSDIKR